MNSADSSMGGGALNTIGINSPAATIHGGYSNNIVNPSALAVVVGNFGTNSVPKSVLISPAGTHGPNRMQVAAPGTTNIGPFSVKTGAPNNYAGVGGTLTNATTQSGSAGTGATNLQTFMVLGHTLTNVGDRLVIRAAGKFSPVADAKQIKLILGSETVFDSGSQTANAGAWVVNAEIIRTGNTSQAVNANYSGTAESLFNTANSLDIAQTNGINTLLAINVTCAANGGVTNRTLTVTYYPVAP